MSSEQVCSATQHTNRGSTGDPWPIAVIVSTNLILLLLLGWVFVRFGSVSACAGLRQRARLTVDVAERSFGILAPGESKTLSYRLSNYDIMPVRIVGAATGCSCHTPEDEELPFEISAGGSKTFTIKFHAYGDPRAVSLPIDLYTNNPAQPKLVLTIAGEIVDPHRPREK